MPRWIAIPKQEMDSLWFTDFLHASAQKLQFPIEFLGNFRRDLGIRDVWPSNCFSQDYLTENLLYWPERLISTAFFIKAMSFCETEKNFCFIFFALHLFSLSSIHAVSRTASEGLLLKFYYTPFWFKTRGQQEQFCNKTTHKLVYFTIFLLLLQMGGLFTFISHFFFASASQRSGILNPWIWLTNGACSSGPDFPMRSRVRTATKFPTLATFQFFCNSLEVT